MRISRKNNLEDIWKLTLDFNLRAIKAGDSNKISRQSKKRLTGKRKETLTFTFHIANSLNNRSSARCSSKRPRPKFPSREIIIARK